MFTSVASWCSNAYPNDESGWARIRRAAVFGLFVALFLAFFKPFGLNNLSGWILYRICFEFGLITFGSIVFLNILVPRLLPGLFDPDEWVVWKEIAYTLLNFIFIGTANFVYLYSMNYTDGSFWEALVSIQISTLAVGILPVTFYIYFDQARMFKKNAQKAHLIDDQLSAIPHSSQNERIIFRNENDKAELQLQANEVLFLMSDGNYLEIFTDKDKHLIRNRMKNIEASVPDNFFRCHRRYIVNLDQIHTISGNARGYELAFNATNLKVPVSRSYIEAFNQRMN